MTIDSMIRGVQNIDPLKLTCLNPLWDNKKAYGGSNMAGIAPYVKFFTQNTDGTFNIPRNYHSHKGMVDNRQVGRKIDVKFNGELRPNQKFLENYEFGVDSILNAYCGFGKSISGAYLISRIKRQTLIICPTVFLCKQWRDELTKFLPGTSLCIAKGSKQPFVHKDVVIMTYSLASKLSFDRLECFGFALLDEGHKIGATTYAPIMEKLPAKERVLLTATWYREDQITDFMRYHFKRIIPIKSTEPPAKLYFIETGFSVNPRFVKGFMNIEKEVNYSPSRQDIVHNIISKCMAKGRKPILIGKRKEPLKQIASKYPNGALLTSDEMKKPNTVEKVRSHSDVIIGINTLLKEGVDCPSADTLIVLSPMGNIEQMIGRIIRKYEGKRPPVVLYLYDNIRQYQNTISAALDHIPNAIYSDTINHSNLEIIL